MIFSESSPVTLDIWDAGYFDGFGEALSTVKDFLAENPGAKGDEVLAELLAERDILFTADVWPPYRDPSR